MVDAATLELAIATWRQHRHDRLATLVDYMAKALLHDEERPPLGAGRGRADRETWWRIAEEGDPLDFERLGVAARGGTQDEVNKRVAFLKGRDDPRLASALLALLADPPYAGVKSRGMLGHMLDAIEASRDKRAAAPTRDLASRYPGIIRSSTGGWVSNRLDEIADAIEALPGFELSGDVAEFCEKWEKHFDVRAARGPSDAYVAELKTAIYADPRDDGARLVFADALIERGDDHGTFIALQVKNARGEGTVETEKQERHLLADHVGKARWAYPLANAGECKFERGFVALVDAYRALPERLIGHPSWATVTEVTGLDRVSFKRAVALLEAPSARNIVRAGTFPGRFVNRLATREWPWEHIAISDVEVLANESWTRFPALHSVALAGGAFDAHLLNGLTRIRTLELNMRVVVDDSLQYLPQLEALVFDSYSRSTCSAAFFEAAGGLRRLVAPRASIDPDAWAHMPQLTEAVCWNTTVNSMVAPQLVRVGLRVPPIVADFDALCSRCPSLSDVTLVYGRGELLVAKGVAALAAVAERSRVDALTVRFGNRDHWIRLTRVQNGGWSCTGDRPEVAAELAADMPNVAFHK